MSIASKWSSSSQEQGLLDSLKIGFAVLQSRGLSAFSGHLIVSSLIVLSFMMLWRRSSSRLHGQQQQLRAEKAMAEHSAAFADLQNRLLAWTRRLPGTQEKANWLLNYVLETAEQDGIRLGGIQPLKEESVGYYSMMSLEVEAQFSYRKLGAWISRLERSKKLVHVSALSLNKTKDASGVNQVRIRLSTLVPRQG